MKTKNSEEKGKRIVIDEEEGVLKIVLISRRKEISLPSRKNAIHNKKGKRTKKITK